MSQKLVCNHFICQVWCYFFKWDVDVTITEQSFKLPKQMFSEIYEDGHAYSTVDKDKKTAHNIKKTISP